MKHEHKRIGHGGGGLHPPNKNWATSISWAAREIWAKPILKDVRICVCVAIFFGRERFSILN